MKTANARWVIWLSLGVAFIVYALPLPWEWRWFRPELPLMVLLYWSLALPHRVGIFSAAVVGATLDILNGTALGALSLGAVTSVLVVLLNYQRIRQFDLLLQTLSVVLFVGLALVCERWLQGLSGMGGGGGLSFMYSLPASALCWPLLRHILRSVRRYYEVE